MGFSTKVVFGSKQWQFRSWRKSGSPGTRFWTVFWNTTLPSDGVVVATGADRTIVGVPTLPRVLLHKGAGTGGPARDVGFPGPYIVKPRFGGSSIGVDFARHGPSMLIPGWTPGTILSRAATRSC